MLFIKIIITLVIIFFAPSIVLMLIKGLNLLNDFLNEVHEFIKEAIEFSIDYWNELLKELLIK